MGLNRVLITALLFGCLSANSLDKMLLSQSFIDSDFDGVADSVDLCPNTDILELVDKKGCAKNQKPQASSGLKTLITIEANYMHKKYKNEENSEDRIDYYEYSLPIEVYFINKNWIYGISFGYSKIDDGTTTTSGVLDTSLSFGYLFVQKNNQILTKAEVTLPTSKNSSKAYYTLYLQDYYTKKRHNFGAGLSYTFGSEISELEATLDYSYSFKKFDVGVDYTLTKPFKNSYKPLHNIGVYTTIYLDKHQVTIKYKKPLSGEREFDNISLKYGYSF